MSSKKIAVSGLYPTRPTAEAAVTTLQDERGFRSTDISVLFPQNGGSKEFRTREGQQGG